MNNGYAFVSLPNVSPITISEPDTKSASVELTNIGSSMDGIPSFGTPPYLILSSGMVCNTPSVSIISVRFSD